MRKRLVVLGFALSQSVAMFATIEDAQSVSDSVAVQTSPVLVVEDSVKRTSEVPLDTADYFDEQNDIIEMEAAKPLPEYRWTTIGVTFGGGLAWYNSTPINNRFAPCLRGGLNFDVPIGQWFSLQPELLFAVRGGGFKTEVGYNVEDNLFYFDVPINCKFSKRMNFSKTCTGRGFVSVGPVLSLGVFGKSTAKELDNEHPSVNNKLFQNNPDEETEHAIYRSFDFSLNFRLGYDFDSDWSFAIGYQLGLVNLMNDSNYDANEVKQYKSVYTDNFPVLTNSSAYMTLGYRW
ncbi:MAG: PorT family protein [Paludibacteraceae bacterium]|nr:PorT family protein [Paludibacteraceae bacterium]MBR6104116.1 PorT family protein [Paludibacteraceae bacterium]